VHPFYFRVPIRREFDRDEFARFLYFERIYFGMSSVRPNSKPFINYENTSTIDSETIAITYRDDGLIDLNWVRVTYLQPDHPEAQQAFETAVARIKEKVPTYTLHELQAMYHDTPPEEDGQRLFAVYATAVATPWAFDPDYLEAMQTYAKDLKATVRAGVVIGIGYIGLTEYIPLLKQLAQDQSDDVQQRARDMLESFQQVQLQS
jgi:hypothetical protein